MNTTEYRNIAEQVLKNKEDILKHFQRDEILADFGIRIIGQLLNTDELYALPTEGLQYGDAYAVGAKSPFNYYIWTRANNLSPVDYWFDFGQIAIAGPAGPRGYTGAPGKNGESSQWFDYVYVVNAPDAAYRDGDMALARDGNVYRYLQGQWSVVTNIKGPTGATGAQGLRGPQGEPGPQGPKGDTGDVGGFIHVASIIASEEQLPDPEIIGDLTVAYLVGAAEPYDLYIQVGSTSAEAQWLNAGPLNVATFVTVDGQFQNTWNADTKLDKNTASSTYIQVYAKDKAGNNRMWDVSNNTAPLNNGIPIYTATGQIRTQPPTSGTHAANKQYVDTLISQLEARISALEQANLITFYIGGIQYRAKKDMLWFDWVYSDYSGGNFSVEMGQIIEGSSGEPITLYGSAVSEGDPIYADTEYDLGVFGV